MKWSREEEEKIKELLYKYKNKTYDEILKLASSNRTKKSLSHKNSRQWHVPREVVSVPLTRHSQKGSKNSNWKGGRTKHSSGYVLVYTPEHPRAHNRYVFEHILVMEKKLGRYVRKDELIHHINGIKDDNRLENLEILTTREHSLKQHPYGLEKKDGLYRGRKIAGGRISFHPEVLEKLPNEFYMEIGKNNEIIIYLDEKIYKGRPI